MYRAKVNIRNTQRCNGEGILEGDPVVVDGGVNPGHQRHSVLVRHEELAVGEEFQQGW